MLDEMNVGHGDCKTKDQLLERIDWVQGKGIIKALQDVSDAQPSRKRHEAGDDASSTGTGSEGVSSTGYSHGTAGTGVSIHNSLSGSEANSANWSWASSSTCIACMKKKKSGAPFSESGLAGVEVATTGARQPQRPASVGVGV